MLAKMHICCVTYKIPQICLHPDPTGGAYDAPQTPSRLGRETPSPQTPPPPIGRLGALRRLDPRAFGARLRSDIFCL